MRAALLASFAIALLALGSCGDGGGVILTPGDDDDDPPAVDCDTDPCGQVRIALTDADGDFLSYAVDLVSIRLEHGNGSRAEVVPDRLRVDFVELADVSEILSAVDIPTGTYERALVRLDFSEAEVSVEVDGLPTPAQVVDANADALGVVELEIIFDEANPLVIAEDAPALLQFDFDLEASHEVNIGTTPVTVTAAPFLIAAIEPVDAREFRVRGPLASVNEAQDRFVVELRPFHHRTAENGAFTVRVDADTACEVDGDELAGDECLVALAELPADAPAEAYGDYDLANGRFTAARVFAAGSVPGAEQDTALGVVVARNQNVLTIRGGTVVRPGDDAIYARGDIQVQVDSATRVTQDGGSPRPLDFDDLSVGQRVQAFGDATSSDFNPTLNARGGGGLVRLEPTRLTGFVLGTQLGELRLDLVSMDGRDPQFFDFDGTGSSSVTTANFRNYQVDTGSIDLGDFEVNDGAGVTGFVAPHQSAPPDFEAESAVPFDELRALLGVGWGFAGTASPFLAMGQNGFTIDPANLDLGQRRFLEIGPRIFDINRDLPEPVRVEPVESGPQRYALARRAEVEVYSDFGDYATRVNGLLRGGWRMRSFTARGVFDVDTTTLAADDIAIWFVEP